MFSIINVCRKTPILLYNSYDVFNTFVSSGFEHCFPVLCLICTYLVIRVLTEYGCFLEILRFDHKLFKVMKVKKADNVLIIIRNKEVG